MFICVEYDPEAITLWAAFRLVELFLDKNVYDEKELEISYEGSMHKVTMARSPLIESSFTIETLK